MENFKDSSRMLESICKELSASNILDVLSRTPLRRLQPILLDAWKKRAYSKKPIDLLNEYERKNQFYGISSFSQDELLKFMQTCFSAVPKNFSLVEMSPITPLGLNSILSNISQNNSLSTVRDSEVASDTTTQLALECALQRKKLLLKEYEGSSNKNVHLCSSHRVLRLQPFDSTKGYTQHFNLLGLCSGGRSFKEEPFAIKWCREQISILLEILKALEFSGFQFFDVTVKLSDINFLEQLIVSLSIPRAELNRHSLDEEYDFFKRFNVEFPREVDSISDLSEEHFRWCGLPNQTAYFSHLERGIINPLRQRFPLVRFCFDFTRKAGLGYYKHICFHIFATSSGKKRIQAADGGAVDWLEKLLQNKREAMVISGIGSELVHKIFKSKK